MDRHETQARIDAQINEWKRNLDAMKTKAEAATGDAKVAYQENVGLLQKQLDELKVRAAKAWDVADDTWDASRKDLESAWSEWEDRAKKAWNELTK